MPVRFAARTDKKDDTNDDPDDEKKRNDGEDNESENLRKATFMCGTKIVSFLLVESLTEIVCRFGSG